jgi:hypothetical protein
MKNSDIQNCHHGEGLARRETIRRFATLYYKE